MAQTEASTDATSQSRQVKAVFFDVAGTLWDGSRCARQVLEVILPHFKGYLPEEDVDEVVRRFNAVLFDQVQSRHLRERRPFSRARRFEALLDSYGVSKPGLAQEMSSKYDGARRLVMRQFVRDDAFHVLTELGRRGIARGALVNGTPAVQRHLLNSIGLERHMDHVVLAEVEGHSKPDVRIFRHVLRTAGLEPHEMLFVGDSPLTDILGAARAGIPTVWFNTGRRRLPKGFPRPDFSITRLTELLPMVEM